MNNMWLGGLLGVALGSSIVGGYIWYDTRQDNTHLTDIKQLNVNDLSSVSQTSKFLSQEIVDARLNELSFKEVMRLFYKDQMRHIYIQEDQLETTNYIGLGDADEMGDETIAIMHPIMNYHTVGGEARFLVIIEKLKVMSDGIISSCHGCSAEADLYTFKKLENGQYQVVSRTRPEPQEFGGSYGRVHLDREQLLNNLQPLGKKLIGTFYQSGFSNMGESTSSWYAIHLSEDNFISCYLIAEASGDNAGNHEPESPLYFNFESTIQVNDNGKKYFPIQVNYSGEKYDQDYVAIEAVKPKVIYNFDIQTQQYQPAD